MRYTLTKASNIPKKEKFGINLDIYPNRKNESGSRVVSSKPDI